MANKAWSDFFNWVLPHVPGCAQTVAEDAIREAAIDFCDSTLIWRRELSIDSVAGGNGTYDLVAPMAAQYSDGNVIQTTSIVDAKFNGVRIFAKTDDELKALFGSDWDSHTGTPLYFNMVDENTARLAPIPTSAIVGGIWLKVAVIPMQEAAEVDEFLWVNYRQEICAGALAELQKSPRKPYTNLAQGAENQRYYDGAVHDAASGKKNNYTRKPLRATTQFR